MMYKATWVETSVREEMIYASSADMVAQMIHDGDIDGYEVDGGVRNVVVVEVPAP